jgi:hypothetical protein
MGVGSDRVTEVKARVEALKTRVRTLQAQLPEAKIAAEGAYPRNESRWAYYRRLKKDWLTATNELSVAKVELTKLCGTTGGDPKWDLIREAWHVLVGLDEAGVDIGDRGHALIDEIEFHVPANKLRADMTRESSPSESEESKP